MKNNIIIYVFITILIPIVAFAAPLGGLVGLLTAFKGLLNLIVPIIFLLCLIFFFWGLSQFILKAGEQKAREEGKTKMIWGIVALFIFVSIFGILNFIGDAIGIPISGTSSSSDYEFESTRCDSEGGC